MAAVDFNGDGKTDMVVSGTSGVGILTNTTLPGPAVVQGGANVTGTGTIHYVAATPPPTDVPQPFSFTPVTNAALNTLYTSNSITVSGTNLPSPVSISGGGQYSVNGGAYTAASGTLQPGMSIPGHRDH